jgi:antitoxin component HigA of HigAB toxin-antitoxin module
MAIVFMDWMRQEVIFSIFGLVSPLNARRQFWRFSLTRQNPIPARSKILVEDASYPVPNVEPNRILRHLMAARNMKQEELVGVISSRGVVSEIVNGKRSISKAQAKILGQLFHVSPSLFI